MRLDAKVRVEYKDLGLDKVIAAALKTNATVVRVGIVGAKASEPTADGRLTNVDNAVIQQFGLAGPPGSPARDFLDAPYRNKSVEVGSVLRRVMTRVLALDETPEQAMDWAGEKLEHIARDAIYVGVPPHNAPATVEKKGFDHALIDTLGLYDAISHQVVRETGDLLEAGSSVGDFEAFEFNVDLGEIGGIE